jgi:hypothetical protein
LFEIPHLLRKFGMTRVGAYQKFEVTHLLRKLGMTGRMI